MIKSGLCSDCVFLAAVLVKMGVGCDRILVLRKCAVKSMNVFSSISMKFSL